MFEFFKHKTRVAQVICIIIILYCVSSIAVLLVAAGIVSHIPHAYLNPRVLIAYSVGSFLLAAITSAYHLATMIRRRKRKCDISAECGRSYKPPKEPA
jgi:Kef-type K+ transport system membrane component KefB